MTRRDQSLPSASAAPKFCIGLATFVAIVFSSVAIVVGHGPEPVRGEASWDALFPASVPAPQAAVTAGPSVFVALSSPRFRPGQQLALGIGVQNPAGGMAADLFVGFLLPDGQTLVILLAGGQFSTASVSALGGLVPTQAVPPNTSFINPGLFQFTFPPTGVPTGVYQAFGALVRQGALADGRVDPGDVLAIDVRPFTFSTGPAGSLPLLDRPFEGEYYTASFFDHFYPQEFVNPTGRIIPYWGEQFDVPLSLDVNHEGYDFSLPEGTPVLAAAGGTVLQAGLGPSGFCPPLNATVQTPQVYVDHVAPNDVHFISRYAHFSRIDVSVGQSVAAGQILGLSGSLGCSTGPHLHFEVFHVDPDTGRRITTDPYGWEGTGPDPWEVHPQGIASVWLWKDGATPTIFREIRLPPNPKPTDTAPVALTTWRWLGADDTHNPNNEFVEISLDPRFVTTPTRDLTGFTLRNNSGDTFGFPPGFHIQLDQPVRIYTGPGASTNTVLFWGLPSGAWDNVRECARLVYPGGGAYRFSNAAGSCD